MKKYLMYDKYDNCYREVIDIEDIKKLIEKYKLQEKEEEDAHLVVWTLQSLIKEEE